jgi:hypothetical protein
MTDPLDTLSALEAARSALLEAAQNHHEHMRWVHEASRHKSMRFSDCRAPQCLDAMRALSVIDAANTAKATLP